MSTQPIILYWIRHFSIRTLINAPAGSGRDSRALRDAGATHLLNVDIREHDPYDADWVQADLETWRPDAPFDAAYVNCFFCLSNIPPGRTDLGHNPGTDFEKAARNIASWPIKWLIIYDTQYGFDWWPAFQEAGFARLVEKRAPDGPDTRCELWRRDG